MEQGRMEQKMLSLIKRQSKFQEIIIAMDSVHRGEHVLFLDDAWQYASMFEYRYHEIMATMSACAAVNLERALICGGGDGLAARELLRFPNVHIDLVEIDPMMIELFSTEKMLTDLNRRSLQDERVHIHIEDAFVFAQNAIKGSYDLVLLDFPSPGDGNKQKQYGDLFSGESADLFASLLKPEGVLTSQTSVQAETLVGFGRYFLDNGYYIWSYDAVYNSQGNHDTFTTASKCRLSKNRSVPKECKLLTDDHIRIGFSKATQYEQEDLDYFRLFEFVEAFDAEPFAFRDI